MAKIRDISIDINRNSAFIRDYAAAEVFSKEGYNDLLRSNILKEVEELEANLKLFKEELNNGKA
jgi:hypothetical protein